MTPKQIATELAQIKKTNFKTDAEYQEFLENSHFTKQDVLDRVKLQISAPRSRKRSPKKRRPRANSEIAAYYESAKAASSRRRKAATSASSSTKTKPKSKRRKALLEKDDSPASWKKVAPKYSSDPTTKTSGGLQKALTEELLRARKT